MLVIFLQEMAAAEAAVGNQTGSQLLLERSLKIAAAVWEILFDFSSGDHFITQRNLDNTIRDFVDYDANLIGVAAGIPPAGWATKILARIDAGRCTHGMI